MHELSVTQSMLELALAKAREAGAERITSLSLVVGDLTGVAEECARFYFDFVARDTIAEGATIAFRGVPAQARCRDCSTTYAPDDTIWACPACGSVSAEIVAGRELLLESIEVDGDTDTPEHTGG
ncbi:MAG: hydrogenase maturation nickel metallochaperone HypA [Chloroflexi bacterium]|nr:hydrogenase maturation nickel metallochaperone HypA [Chloroflexota bacterium]